MFDMSSAETQVFSRMRNIQKTKRLWKYFLCVLVAPYVFYHMPSLVRFLIGFVPMDKCALESAEMLNLDHSVDASLDLQSRQGVQTCTQWKAPVIWEGMFDAALYDQTHMKKGSSVALTVFAVGRYLDTYLEAFLRSSERHFMVGLPVSYYVFTDAPEKVPHVALGPKRSLRVISVEKPSRWQDASMMRMKVISEAIESEIRHRCTHVFCLDVDQEFTGRFGSEALGDSVALLHAYYYNLPKWLFTYDNNPVSKAYMETGDFYYHAAVFGGSWRSVKALTDWCYRRIEEDKHNGVEARWHDESHLNKYFWLHKPSRVLSPEYCWDRNIGYRSQIRVARLQWATKYYDLLRQQ